MAHSMPSVAASWRRRLSASAATIGRTRAHWLFRLCTISVCLGVAWQRIPAAFTGAPLALFVRGGLHARGLPRQSMQTALPRAAGGTEAALVERVEQIRSSDENGEPLWTAYCNEKGGGVMDPSAHPIEFVQKFVDICGSERAPEDVIAVMIQILQGDAEANQEWRAYCAEEGIGVTDARLLSAGFVQNWLADYSAKQARKVELVPPELAERTVALLGSDRDAEELWNLYCDQVGDRGREPKVHTSKFVRRFLALYAPGRATETASDKVADLISRDASMRYFWSKYCSQEGIGISNPKVLPAFFVDRFLEAYDAGAIEPVEMASEEAARTLNDVLTKEDRLREEWEVLCAQEGGGTTDPKLLPNDFVQSFIKEHS